MKSESQGCDKGWLLDQPIAHYRITANVQSNGYN